MTVIHRAEQRIAQSSLSSNSRSTRRSSRVEGPPPSMHQGGAPEDGCSALGRLQLREPTHSGVAESLKTAVVTGRHFAPHSPCRTTPRRPRRLQNRTSEDRSGRASHCAPPRALSGLEAWSTLATRSPFDQPGPLCVGARTADSLAESPLVPSAYDRTWSATSPERRRSSVPLRRMSPSLHTSPTLAKLRHTVRRARPRAVLKIGRQSGDLLLERVDDRLLEHRS